jgi:hypothetical protein
MNLPCNVYLFTRLLVHSRNFLKVTNVTGLTQTLRVAADHTGLNPCEDQKSDSIMSA